MPTLNWIGKDKVVNHHQDVPYKVLEHKYGFRDGKQGEKEVGSGNMIIHGDNLEALKSLLPKYEGKIDCIYIDPPYNTGNEGWVYNDNVNHPKIKKWLGDVVGKEGDDLTRHDKWLCMIYPRLKLLSKLLSIHGVIYISIDDNELASLKLLCDEIFGRNRFLGYISRKQSSGSKNDTGNNKIITTVDYLAVYSKQDFSFYPYQVKNTKKFGYTDADGNFSIRPLEMQGGDDTLKLRHKMGYSIYYNSKSNEVQTLHDYDLENENIYEEPLAKLLNSGFKCYRPRKRGEELGIWRWGTETFNKRFQNNLVHFDDNRVYMKERATKFINKYPDALLDTFLNSQGTSEVKDIFGSKKFDFPKPSSLVKFLIQVGTNEKSIVLDSFAGSGTTAHAVLNLNKEDDGNRKFIMIEMEDYADSITAERVKRVIKGYGKDKKKVEGTGGSFNYYELGESLFLEDEILNEEVSLDKIKQYIWYSETRTGITKSNSKHKHHLGSKDEMDYYFYYDKDQLTTLDYNFLSTIKTKAIQYVIYADTCLLTDDFMSEHNITFKKIPRDITRF